ncbi:hypothetical protein ACEWY4_017332 [Coilia grayii]|uniref:Ig-like domain-containing protein n=1 Tax=Coilia grayii TaxID=363190 RepID=A0ABD1JGI5_9TELE
MMRLSFTDSCCGKNILRKAHVGDDVEITCKYPENNRGNTKYFYRRDRNTIFSGSTSSDSSQDTRYLISDGRANSEFNVSITRLQLKDAGLYWCGVSTGGDTGSVNLIAEVKLEVTDANGQISPENSKSTRSPSTLVYSDLDTHSFDHSTIVIVCVLLVVLVTGLVGVMVFVRKKRKEQGHSSSTAGKNDKHKTPQTDCVYQEINDTSCPAVLSSNLGSSSPSAAPYCSNYATVTFHKRPGAEGQEGRSAAAPREKVTSEYATIHHRT